MKNIKFSSYNHIKGPLKHTILFRVIKLKNKFSFSDNEYRIHLTSTLRENLSIQFDLGSLKQKIKYMFFMMNIELILQSLLGTIEAYNSI